MKYAQRHQGGVISVGCRNLALNQITEGSQAKRHAAGLLLR